MKRLWITLVFLLAFAMGAAFGELRETDFDLFEKIDASGAQALIDVIAQPPAPENVRLLCSALRRIRELRVTAARPQVRELIDATVPSANQGAGKRTAWMRTVFNMGVKALGEISRETNDALILFRYYKEVYDDEGRYWIVVALGDMEGVSAAADKLVDIAGEMLTTWKGNSDERLLGVFLDAVTVHNSRKFVLPLMKLERKLRLSEPMYNRMEATIKNLNTRGNP